MDRRSKSINLVKPDQSTHVPHVSLWEQAYQIFCIGHLLPEKVDCRMATAILLLLIEPGTKARLFQKKYLAEETLRTRVIRHFEIQFREQYNPSSFAKTLKWLLAQEILFLKNKPGERMVSLVAKSSLATTPQAREIIQMVLVTANHFKSI